MTRHYSIGNNWDVSWTLIYWLSFLHFCSLGGKRMCGSWHTTANLANPYVTQNLENLWCTCEDAPFYQVQSGCFYVGWTGRGQPDLVIIPRTQHEIETWTTQSNHTCLSILCQWRQCFLVFNVPRFESYNVFQIYNIQNLTLLLALYVC